MLPENWFVKIPCNLYINHRNNPIFEKVLEYIKSKYYITFTGHASDKAYYGVYRNGAVCYNIKNLPKDATILSLEEWENLFENKSENYYSIF